MGIIERQSIKNSIVAYLGVLIGGISVLFVYPLNDEIYGLSQFLYSSAMLFFPLIALGGQGVLLRFFPDFKNQKSDSGLLSFTVLLALIGFVVLVIFYAVFQEILFKGLVKIGWNAQLFRAYAPLIIVMSLVIVLSGLLSTHASNYNRIVVPEIIDRFAFKVYLPVLVLLFVWGLLSTQIFVYAVAVFFTLSALALFVYLRFIAQLEFNIDWKKIKAKKNEIIQFMGFGSFQSMSAMMAFRIDSVMIPLMISLQANGLYTKILFMAGIIDLPLAAIERISAPIIRKAFTENNRKEIQYIYERAALNLTLFGSYLFVLLYYTLPYVFALSSNPSSFKGGLLIFFFLGIAKLINMLTSVNNSMIIYSVHYKYNLLFIGILSVLNVVGNYFFMQHYGVLGAAISTAISIAIFNVLKLMFIYRKMHFWPFSNKLFAVLCFAGVLMLAQWFIPSIENPFLGLVVYPTVLSLLFFVFAIRFQISEEFTQKIKAFNIPLKGLE